MEEGFSTAVQVVVVLSVLMQELVNRWLSNVLWRGECRGCHTKIDYCNPWKGKH